MNQTVLLAILLLAPLVGFLINGTQYKKFSCNLAGSIATLAVFISFICSVLFFIELQEMGEGAARIGVTFFNWIDVGSVSIPAGFAIDPVSAIMILIITGVGSLIHMFSIGYMHHDHGAAKYFAYLNLFIFNMLLLVLGDNLLIMFVGWEGVGLCSYLFAGDIFDFCHVWDFTVSKLITSSSCNSRSGMGWPYHACMSIFIYWCERKVSADSSLRLAS